MYQYPKSVEEAAKILDMTKPNWEKKIDFSKLTMSNCSNCILGQIFGHYDYGMRIFDVSGSYNIGHYLLDRIFGSHAKLADWTIEVNKRLTNVHNFNWAMKQVGHRKVIKRAKWTLEVSKLNVNSMHYSLEDFNSTDYFVVAKVPTVFDIKQGQKFKILRGETCIAFTGRTYIKNSYELQFNTYLDKVVAFTDLENGAITKRFEKDAKLIEVELL